MRHLIRLVPLLALALLLGGPVPSRAQSQGQDGYAAIRLDGKDAIGADLALVPRPGGNDWLALMYLSDLGALYSGSCSTVCPPRVRLTEGADRGRFVSAAARPGLPGSPAFVAFYNATSGDLEAIDCTDGSCNFGLLRVLDTQGDVGAGTATAVDPATGRPYVAYYDASNAALRLYRCADAGCSSGDSVQVDSGDDRGRNPAMSIVGGQLIIVHDDTDTGELRIATASAPYASFAVRTIGVGRHASIVPNVSGFADILYTGADANVERRRCADAGCSVLQAPGALTSGVASGQDVSATRLPDGHLFVTHRDETVGALQGIRCNDADCTAPTRFTVESGVGLGTPSQALAFASGTPLVVYRDAAQAELRSALCMDAGCTLLQRRVAGNGILASSPDVAVRADGRAVAIWTRMRGPRMALCDDTDCSSITYRDPVSANSDGSRPSILVRPDGRPFAFYSYLGGNAAWDCSDVDCSDGSLRVIGGTGNATGDYTEMALRPDGRPVLLYYQRSSNDVFVYDCDDAGCSSGTAHRVADESTAQSTFLTGFSIAVGADNRPFVAYHVSFQPMPGTFAGEDRLLRCDDVACSSASASTLGTEQGFFTVPLAVRDDGRAVLIEQTNSGRRLVTCNDADCSAPVRTSLPNPFDTIQSLGLFGGNVPLYASGLVGSGGYWQCEDAGCGAPLRVTTIVDATSPQRGFTPRMALRSDGAPVLVFGEQDLGDVWLSLGQNAQVFADGFEN